MAVRTRLKPVARSWVLSEELLAEIAAIAIERSISHSAVLRDLVRRGLADYQREQDLLKKLQSRSV